ncbi:MAG: hypothetical protein WBC37_08025, partial [Burkholderiaceae bacterium]
MKNPAAPLLHEVLQIVQQELARPVYLWQLAVVAGALAGAWLFARMTRRHVEARVQAEARKPTGRVDLLQFSIDGFRRLAFPVSALVLVALGGLGLRAAGLVRHTADSQLLRLAFTLLAAAAAIRLSVYVLRRSFPRSNW